MPGLADALRDPIALPPNRIPRFYHGGGLLGAFRGGEGATDDGPPEDWVGSATRTWTPPGEPPSALGLSRVEIAGRDMTMADALAEAPAALIGEPFLAKAGSTLGLLVKLLDAGERLPVHCHPTRDAAARLLGSPFGKTEAWLILEVSARPARVWAGFRERIESGQLRDWIERRDSEALLASLVEHEVAPGDVILIPAGIPHAIGAGIFLLELQEPTDFSVVAETRGFPIAPDDAALRLGWNTAIDFFDTDGAGDPRQRPTAVADGTTRLLGREADPFFRAIRLRVGGEHSVELEPCFAVGVVLGGSGELRGVSRSLALRRGTTFALPAAATERAVLAGDDLDLVLCLPPVADLAPLAGPRGR